MRTVFVALCTALASASVPSLTLNTTVCAHLGAVEVSWAGCETCTPGSFIGVFYGSANLSRIAPQPYPAEAPWTATAAAKWLPLPAGNTAFGSYVIALVNAYETATIALFNGSLAEPSVVAESPSITFLDADAPLRGHIARTSLPTEMLVSCLSHSLAPRVFARVRNTLLPALQSSPYS